MVCLNQLISISLILKNVVYIISANSLYHFRLLYLRLVKKGVSNIFISFVINTGLSTLSCRYWLPHFSNLYTTHWHRHKSFAFKNENTVLLISLRRFSFFCSRDKVLRMLCLYEVNFCYYVFLLFILIGCMIY